MARSGFDSQADVKHKALRYLSYWPGIDSTANQRQRGPESYSPPLDAGWGRQPILFFVRRARERLYLH